MNCEKFRSNITAFLAGELDERLSQEHRRHAEQCPNCATEIKSTATLVNMLETHSHRDVPEHVEARVLNNLETLRNKSRQQMASPAPLLSCIQGAFTMKRAIIAVCLLIVVIGIGLGILPASKENAVLAQVADAMEKVRTAHLVVEVRKNTGEYYTEELWVKLPSQYRWKYRDREIADNGQKSVTVQTSNGITTATISQPKGLRNSNGDGDFLFLFNFRELVKSNQSDVTSQKSVVLQDGRKATVFDLNDSRVTIDNATGRIIAMEGSSALRHWVIKHIDYDQDIPDSTFELKIPKNAVVIDTLHPSAFSAEVEHNRKAIAAKLEASGAWNLGSGPMHSGSGSGSAVHDGMRFASLDTGWAGIFYIPERNAYYVLGRWHVTDDKTKGFNLVVQDCEFSAPRKPEFAPLLAPRVLVKDAKPGQIGDWDLQNLGPGPLTLIEKYTHKDGLVLEIQGKAKHIPDGKVYEDETVKMEELYHLPYDEFYPDDLYWGNKPPEQTQYLKLYVDFHNRIATILSNKNAKGYSVYDGAEIQDMGFLDDEVPLSEGKLQLTRIHRPRLDDGDDLSKYLGYALRVPAKRVFLCVGHVKVKYPGRPERICVNGVVSYNGEILESEE